MARRATVFVFALLYALAGSFGAAKAAERAPANQTAGKGDQIALASDVRLGGDEKQTRFVLDLNRKISFVAFTLADPYRVVLDLPQVDFRLPPKAGESGRGLVKAFRYGLVMPGGSRIVIDTKSPVRIDKIFALDPAEGQPARMVLDLAATDRESFLRTIATEARAPRPGRKSEAPPKHSGDPRPLIVIDPGHGGIDTGTKAASGEMEKSIVLDFALLLRDRIEKIGKYRVAMTRSDDSFITLGDRVRFARERQAALFISIHADSIPHSEGEAQGATVYTLSERASDSQAARLADAENRADVISGVDLTAEPNDVADILIDLAQRETKTYSQQFAKTLVGEMKTAAKLHKHPLRAAGFKVLKAPDVPSVLVELGYVSTKGDLKQMMSDGWRLRTTDSIVQAVESFFTPRIAGAGGQQ